jgi:hypothetical protein
MDQPLSRQRRRTDHPNRVRPHLSIGITGHRHLDTEIARPKVASLLRAVGYAAEKVWSAAPDVFEPVVPVLSLVTPLAAGADQMAAEEGLEAGYRIHAILPLPLADYADDFSDHDRERLKLLLARAQCCLELPAQTGGRTHAYALAGRASVAHSDLIIAIWDGEPARGHGGTAEVVDHAFRRGVPVLHIPAADGAAAQIIWAGYEPQIQHDRLDDAPRREVDADNLDRLLSILLSPPAAVEERAFLRRFLAEHQRTVRARLEYPLLLALTGAQRIRRSAWRSAPYLSGAREEWALFRSSSEEARHGVSVALDRITDAYGWSDRLAQHFAQTYRSGHVLNFLLAALAVLLALGGLFLPTVKLWLATAELLAILGFVLNTRVGTRSNWHRRWLDYRQLAERLRPMRSLKLLGAARPDIGPRTFGRHDSWVDWYAASIWRESGCPSGALPYDMEEIVRFLVEEEISPQIAYHQASARQMHRLDHNLHKLGLLLFGLTILSCFVFLVSYFVFYDWVAHHANGFIFLSAGLPALGAALFGIRIQGEFTGSAERSLGTSAALEAIRSELVKPGITLSRATDLLEAAARTMFADLGEWRLAYQQRRLELPG